MSLDMRGHIDSVFRSTPATRISYSPGGYVDGVWVDGIPTQSPHTVTLQPLNNKEIQQLQIGAERVGDVRKIYVNDGDLYSITPSDDWAFDAVDGLFKSIALDNRPWHNYCKVIVSRYDQS